jgi:hypothetical protein
MSIYSRMLLISDVFEGCLASLIRRGRVNGPLVESLGEALTLVAKLDDSLGFVMGTLKLVVHIVQGFLYSRHLLVEVLQLL